MSRKYYAHFITEMPPIAGPGEYSGVVELQRALRPERELPELRARGFRLLRASQAVR